MAAVLTATGVFVYLRLGAELDRALADTLRSRADDAVAFVKRSGTALSASDTGRFTEADENFIEILDGRGTVVARSADVDKEPLLSGDELARARDRPLMTGPRSLPQIDDQPIRLLATPLERDGRRLIVIVGASTDERDDALHSVAMQMLIGGLIALLLATAAAFGVVRAALRPVERMRREAAAISASEPGRRLPLPEARDELSRLGATLNAMLERLEGALTRERAFVSDASHELRTPLAILQGELELALREGRSPEELRHAVRAAAEESDRLARIAEDLLVIARFDQGRLPLRREGTDIRQLFATVQRRFARPADEAGARIDIDAADGANVFADRLRLEQALGNMVDNALRHGAREVRLTALRADRRIELHVLDDGPGFDAQFLARAFERFTRADHARGGDGAGLGLAVVDGIARAHGGTAQAANRSPAGADVWLTLPSLGDDRDATPS